MRYNFILIFVLLLFGFKANSQSFEVSQNKGCVPFTVTIIPNFAGCAAPQNFIYAYESQNPSNDTSTTHTYTTPGIFTITGNLACGGGGVTTLRRVVTVLGVSRPLFNADGCAALQGRVQINNSVYDQYQVKWQSGSLYDSLTRAQVLSGSNSLTHTYSSPLQVIISVSGVYIYSVAGLSGLQKCGTTITDTITPRTSLTGANIRQIQVNNLSSDSGRVTLTFFATANTKYKLRQKINNGSYVIVDTLGSFANINPAVPLDHQIRGLNTNGNTYCFILSAFDDCGNSLDSDEICTTRLSATADASGNTATWTSHPNGAPVTYSLSANGGAILTTVSGVSQPSIYTYLDPNVQCSQIYCYEVSAAFGTKGQRSLSAQYCVQGLRPTTVDSVRNFNSSFENDQLVLSWKATTAAGISYILYTYDASGNMQKMDSVNGTTANAKNKEAKCYGISARQTCGQSTIVKTCPLKSTAQKDNLVQNSVYWQDPYVNGDNTSVIQYTLEMYSEDGTLIRSEDLGSATTYIHNPIDTSHQKVRYRVKATVPGDAGIITVYSGSSEVIQDLRMWVPDAFTPNNDGLNDSYVVKGLFFDNFELVIYNRWGEVVFSTNDKTKGWDGGSFSPGLYHYYAKAKDKYGNQLTDTKTLQLIR